LAGIAPGVLALVISTAGCGDSKEAKASGPQAMPVKVQTAKAEKIDDTTEYVATLKSRDSAVVMPQVEGIITQIYVHSGARRRWRADDADRSREAAGYSQ